MGAPMVFVHGFGGDLHVWDRLWRALGPGRAMARYDLRGFGRSEAEPGRPFHHANDLAVLLDALEITRCVLVGVSMGAAIALNFALDRPDRVHRLVLISPSIVGWEWSPAWTTLWEQIVEQARRGDMAAAKRLWLAHPMFATALETPGGADLRAEVARFHGRQWLQDDEAPALPDLERLHRLARPALLLSGERDLPDFRLMADLIEGAVPDLLRIDVPGRGHLLPLEDPACCARQITMFLEEHKRRA